MNFLTFGEIEDGDVNVYISQDVYKALEKLSASDTSKELGSIIIGDYCLELGKTHVIISEYIEAKYADASASTLTFTHETWNYIHSEHERLYPGKKIIGWQHTHPNYGIFLSNYDLFIHENFFNLPFQIAYVIDPIQNLRGFFQWKNGKIEKLKGYYIYDDVGKPIKIEQTKVKKAEPILVKVSKLTMVLIILLCVSTIFLSFCVFSLNKKYESQLKKQEEILDELSTQSNIINNQADTIAKLQEQLVNGILDGYKQTTAADLIEMLENHEITLQNQEKTLNELKAFVESSKEDSNNAKFTVYTVVAGDTLAKICSEHGLDYNTNIRIIIELNGIENVNLIYVGQKILLPLY
ncbi:MAG: LysM peptidoglycan-binding domain-containing protein [Ruminococcus sp.]|nr:LysM peptidoglycan-binding domain-containing protein [Ruminococcus sp.]